MLTWASYRQIVCLLCLSFLLLFLALLSFQGESGMFSTVNENLHLVSQIHGGELPVHVTAFARDYCLYL